MGKEIYVKIDRHVKLNKKKILLSDIATTHSTDNETRKQLDNIMVLSIECNESSMYAMTFMKIVELIHRKKSDISVINEGENEFIIEYVNPSDRSANKYAEYAKAAFVALVSFFGAAFAVMTFNLDANVADLFDGIYKSVTGTDKQGAATILEFSYCIGLPIGIVVFFNHFSRKKLTSDPTPIHVEMRNYEKQLDESTIEDSSREGRTIDVT